MFCAAVLLQGSFTAVGGLTAVLYNNAALADLLDEVTVSSPGQPGIVLGFSIN